MREAHTTERRKTPAAPHWQGLGAALTMAHRQTHAADINVPRAQFNHQDLRSVQSKLHYLGGRYMYEPFEPFVIICC
jgi:hypothetical protein